MTAASVGVDMIGGSQIKRASTLGGRGRPRSNVREEENADSSAAVRGCPSNWAFTGRPLFATRDLMASMMRKLPTQRSTDKTPCV